MVCTYLNASIMIFCMKLWSQYFHHFESIYYYS
nr:MAG TPA: hypothetical protein [Caudoviricetes sp.]